MLGRSAIREFPDMSNAYNTDDEIVLSVGKRFPVLHARAPVALAHWHDSPTRMTNSARLRLRGVRQLVRNHRAEILHEHGLGRLMLWWLRVLRVVLQWQNESATNRLRTRRESPRRVDSSVHWAVRIYARITTTLEGRRTSV